MKKMIAILLCTYFISTNIQAQEKDSTASINFGPPTVVIGEYMPDTLLVDTLKQHHTVSEYLGKYILLDFWAHDCGACLKAIPELKEIYEKNSDLFTVVSINLDAYRYTFRKTTEVKQLPWPSLWDGGKEYNSGKQFNGISKRYNINSLPTFVWISPEGIVLKQWAGYGKGILKDQLESLLKEADYSKITMP